MYFYVDGKKTTQTDTQEKERIILDIQNLGVIAGYGLARTLYYDWLNKYQASGLEGLEEEKTWMLMLRAGYQVTTDLLKQLEFIINHKKV